MHYKKIILPLLLTATAALPFSIASADDAALVKEKCGTCHGNDGNSKDEKVPSIAGFSADAIEDILSQYKSGDRKGAKYTPEGGKETDMGEIANKISDDDTQKIITFLAAQTFKPIKQPIDEALAKKGKKLHKKKCEKCHSDNGSNASDDASILAGQWEAYLQKEFDNIAADKRDIPRKMKKRFKKLSKEDRTALIKFYVSQQ